MKYLSVCSGIESATVAWHPLGWEAFAYSEIEKFLCAVLQHHYPQTPNFGDMTKFKEWPNANVDVLVGGTPCQSFSIAGLRKGLDDPRGNLMLTYLAIADKYRPKWIVWENVPGVLSSNGGRDFGTFLGGLAKLGYGFAYRVLDAQYVRTDGYPYAVPQRRRRVFVVGHIGDWRRAAAVLFDRESLSWNPPPRRCAGQKATANARTGTTCSGKDTFGTLMANVGTKQWLGNQEALSGDYHVFGLAGNTIGRQPLNGGNGNGNGNGYGYDDGGASYTLTKTDVHAVAFHSQASSTQSMNPSEVCPTLDKSKLAAVAFKMRGGCEGGGKGYLGSDETAFTLSTTQDQQVAFYENHANDSRVTEMGDVCTTVTSRWGTGGGNVPYVQGDAIGWNGDHTTKSMHEVMPCMRAGQGGEGYGVAKNMQVRRLTPTECARLQGFPDDYLSQVPCASDSAIYKALGNSMAVNVMQLLGERIAMVDAIADMKAVA